MTGIQPFTFPDTGQPVRAIEVHGKPWFILSDAAKILGYRDAEHAARLLRDSQINTLPEGIAADLGRQGGRLPKIITEGGLYRLVMRSNVEMAERFQDWVTDEVLPSIRRTGSYSHTSPPEIQAPATYAEALRALADQHEAREAAEQRAAELEPDAAYTRRTVEADGLRLVGQVAKAWGMREVELREYLAVEGLMIRGGHRHNDPTAYAVERDWLVSKSRLVGTPARKTWTTYLTPRGEVGVWRRRYNQGLEANPSPPPQLQLVDGGVA